MKLNMICIKLHKPKMWTFDVLLNISD